MTLFTSRPSKPGLIRLKADTHVQGSISTVVDLLEAKNISWATYQESSPEDGYFGYKYGFKLHPPVANV
jgi:hypothetical protein